MRRTRVAALMTGLLLLCAVVVLTLVVGVAHRLRDGRMRAARPPRVGSAGPSVASSAPAGSATGAPPGQPTPAQPTTAQPTPAERTPAQPTPSGATPDLRAVLAGLGHAPGSTATLLQFSSAFCAPCRATRRILQEVSGMVDGVAHVEVDAEQHLDLVRRLRIRKTPTTLVLNSAAREVKRASGQPRKADVLAAIGQALP